MKFRTVFHHNASHEQYAMLAVRVRDHYTDTSVAKLSDFKQ